LQLGFNSILADIQKIESHRKLVLGSHLLSDLVDVCLSYIPDLFCHRLLEGEGKLSLFTLRNISSL
jgi:hypothetical protein